MQCNMTAMLGQLCVLGACVLLYFEADVMFDAADITIKPDLGILTDFSEDHHRRFHVYLSLCMMMSFVSMLFCVSAFTCCLRSSTRTLGSRARKFGLLLWFVDVVFLFSTVVLIGNLGSLFLLARMTSHGPCGALLQADGGQHFFMDLSSLISSSSVPEGAKGSLLDEDSAIVKLSEHRNNKEGGKGDSSVDIDRDDLMGSSSSGGLDQKKTNHRSSSSIGSSSSSRHLLMELVHFNKVLANRGKQEYVPRRSSSSGSGDSSSTSGNSNNSHSQGRSQKDESVDIAEHSGQSVHLPTVDTAGSSEDSKQKNTTLLAQEEQQQEQTHHTNAAASLLSASAPAAPTTSNTKVCAPLSSFSLGLDVACKDLPLWCPSIFRFASAVSYVLLGAFLLFVGFLCCTVILTATLARGGYSPTSLSSSSKRSFLRANRGSGKTMSGEGGEGAVSSSFQTNDKKNGGSATLTTANARAEYERGIVFGYEVALKKMRDGVLPLGPKVGLKGGGHSNNCVPTSQTGCESALWGRRSSSSSSSQFPLLDNQNTGIQTNKNRQSLVQLEGDKSFHTSKNREVKVDDLGRGYLSWKHQEPETNQEDVHNHVNNS